LASAFGGVVFDERGRVLLRKPTGEFDGYLWTFPKGRLEEGESPEAAALREVRQETGVEAEIVAAIPGTFKGGTSLNTYYRMRLLHDHADFDRGESEDVKWATPDEARKLIAKTRNETGRKRDLDVLKAAVALAGDE
jgi:8-oxo-dGTP pyrophosphatase MutT (NUDIX family)